MISLTCDYHIQRLRMMRQSTMQQKFYHPGHMCLLAKKRKGLKSVWPKVGGKNRNYLFYPSAKSRRELKIKTLGVTFRGASAYYVQKSIAPQKQAVCQFRRKKIIENFRQTFFSTSKNEMLGIV